jgi:FtsZ-interacting cell division protein YlmF
MSEYQYYEFQAIDRPLTDEEQKILRRYSGRARITSTRFVNSYSYGDFRGDESDWMAKYFDAFVYMANWGTHRLMLRLSSSLLPPDSIERYCAEDSFSARVVGQHIILDFRSDEEGSDGGWIEDDNDTLSALVPIRADLAAGDMRALYIAWLAGAQNGEFDNDAEEPPCPPGLGKLGSALGAFAEFLGIDQDLIDAAATASPDLPAINADVLRRWLSTLSEEEKTEMLVLLLDGEAHVRAEILIPVRKWCAAEAPVADAKPRTVRELLEAAGDRAEERRRQQRERATREKARREREEAAARELRLNALAKREEEAWRRVGALIVSKQPKNYDEAIALLRDLRDLCVCAGREAEAAARIQGLQQEHANKPSFIKRLREAGLHA